MSQAVNTVFRLSWAERTALRRAAVASGLSPSDYVRSRLVSDELPPILMREPERGEVRDCRVTVRLDRPIRRQLLALADERSLGLVGYIRARVFGEAHASSRCRSSEPFTGEDERLLHSFKVRLDRKLWSKLTRDAARVRLSKANYLRACVRQQRLIAVPEVNLAVAFDLGRVGNNLNQLTRYFHTPSEEDPSDDEVSRALEELRGLLHEVRRELRGE